MLVYSLFILLYKADARTHTEPFSLWFFSFLTSNNIIDILKVVPFTSSPQLVNLGERGDKMIGSHTLSKISPEKLEQILFESCLLFIIY